jgi:hypothetical protein
MTSANHFRQWMELRERLLVEERAFAREHAAWKRGEATDIEALSIKQSEIRALRALSRSLVRRSVAAPPEHAAAPGRPADERSR